MQSPSETAVPKSNKVIVATLVLLIVVLGAGLGYYYVQSSATISNLKSQNGSLQGQLVTANSNYASAKDQLGQQEAQISALNSNVSALESKLSADVAQIGSDQSQVASLQGKIVTANASIATLSLQNGEDSQLISDLKTNVTGFQNAISSLNSQITSLNGQVNQLESTVHNDDSILSMSVSTLEISSMAVSPEANKITYLGNGFTISTAGYLLITISGTFNPYSVELGVNNTLTTLTSTPWRWVMVGYVAGANPYTVLAPVVPGTVMPYIITNETGVSATVSVTYYT